MISPVAIIQFLIAALYFANMLTYGFTIFRLRKKFGAGETIRLLGAYIYNHPKRYITVFILMAVSAIIILPASLIGVITMFDPAFTGLDVMEYNILSLLSIIVNVSFFTIYWIINLRYWRRFI